MAKKPRKQRLGQSVTDVTKVVIYPSSMHYGRPSRTIIVRRSDGMDYEFQLSGFKKDIPVCIRKTRERRR